MADMNLRNLSMPEIEHALITLPALISREEEELADLTADYEREYAKAIMSSEARNKEGREAEADLAVNDLLRAKLKQQAKYRSLLNKNENVKELARNKRAEIKSNIAPEFGN
jgi:hypothetical protein